MHLVLTKIAGDGSLVDAFNIISSHHLRDLDKEVDITFSVLTGIAADRSLLDAFDFIFDRV